MKRLLIAACLALASCATPIPAGPSVVADQTTLDESGALSAELAYKAARTAVDLAVDAGVLKGERAAQFAVLDNKAFAALKTVRSAYAAGNSADYATALVSARAAVSDLLTLVGR